MPGGGGPEAVVWAGTVAAKLGSAAVLGVTATGREGSTARWPRTTQAPAPRSTSRTTPTSHRVRTSPSLASEGPRSNRRLVGAFGISRLIAANFPGLQTGSLSVLSGVTLLLIAVALIACYMPARTASHQPDRSAAGGIGAPLVQMLSEAASRFRRAHSKRNRLTKYDAKTF